MKTNKLYNLCFLILMVCNCQITLGTNLFQEPNHIRQFDDGFKERYSSDKYNYEGKEIVTKTPVGSGNYEDYKKKEKIKRKERDNSESLSINFGPFAWLFYIALGLAVGYLVYILFNEGGSGLFSSKQNKKLHTDFEDITAENIENADIHTLIKRAENNNNYRLATRYYYLLILKTLSQKNHIKFEDDKTNSEYLNEISDKPFSSKFSYTSYLYNYIWYGEFPLDVEKYNQSKHHFETLLNQVK